MNSLALTLGAYLLFVTSCGVIFLCGDPHDSGVLGRCNRMFAITIPKVAKQGIQKIPVLGPRLVYAADNGYDYVCFRPNPLLQLLYVVLVLGGYAIFLLQCLPHMPNAFMAPYHNYTTHIAVFITMCTFILASRKSPGYVNKKSVSLYLKSYEYDNFLYVPQDCTTCEVQKPARSKHCPICKTCVATFDHHCPWINTCVGERNKRYFISFLVSTALLLSYATFVVTGVILHHIDRHKLLTQTFVNRKTGEKVEASFGIIAQFIMSRYGWMVMLFVLCAIMGVVLWGFLFYHLYLVARGKTTNEVAKWDSVQGFYANSLKEYRESHKASGKPPIKQVPAKTPLATRPPEEYPDSIPDNTYDFGIRTNFYDMMFPRCERNFESLVQTSVEESDDQPDTKNDVKSKKQTGSLRRRKNK